MTTSRRPIVGHLLDAANLVTLAGLLSSISAITFAVRGDFAIAAIGLVLDMVGAGATRAVGLLAFGGFAAAYVPGAFAIVGAVAFRLSYFDAHGLDEQTGRYVGMPTDQAIVAFAALMLLETQLGQELFPVVLYAGAMVLVALMVSPLRFPKLTGRPFYAINGVAFGIAALHAVRLIV